MRRLGAAHRQRHEREDPAQREREGADECYARDRLSDAALEAEADDVTDRDHQQDDQDVAEQDRKSTRLNSSHQIISYAVFCLKKKKRTGHSAAPIPAPAAPQRPPPHGARRTPPSAVTAR